MKPAGNYVWNDLELAEYTRLLPNQTGLENYIFIDECNSFNRWNHPMWVIVSSENPYTDPWIAISVSESPEIIQSGNNYRNLPELNGSLIQKNKELITKFYPVIKDISEEIVDSSVIYDMLEQTGFDWNYYDIITLYNNLKTDYLLEANQVSLKR